MCKRGDIILVNKYVSQGNDVSRHSFIVFDDKNGTIKGLNYDMVTLVLSSFKDDEQKERKLRYPGNFPITADDVDVIDGNEKEGYIKADQFYFFDKEKLDFKVIGMLNIDTFNALIDFMKDYLADGNKIEPITDNL